MNRFHAILARRAVELGAGNAEGRKRLYAGARTQLDQIIARANPPMSAYQRLKQMQELESAIADIEAHIDALIAASHPPGQTAPRRPAPPHHAPQPPRRAQPPVQDAYPPAREDALPPPPVPPAGEHSTPLPPRQGRNVDELLSEYEESRLSFGIIMAIIGGLAVLMVIGVIIALDPSSLDVLRRNPG